MNWLRAYKKLRTHSAKYQKRVSSAENELRGMVIQHFGNKIFQKNLPFLDGYI